MPSDVLHTPMPKSTQNVVIILGVVASALLVASSILTFPGGVGEFLRHYHTWKAAVGIYIVVAALALSVALPHPNA